MPPPESEDNSKKALIDVANEFINTSDQDYSSDINPEEINQDLQTEIKNLYREVKDKINFNTEENIVDSVASMSVHTEHTLNTSSVIRMFPKFYMSHPETAMECTLASGMLKLALEENGFDNVHTTLLTGHQVTSREHEDGSITIYDPSTRHTDNDRVSHGFMHTFGRGEIVDRQDVYDNTGKRKGYKFRIETQRKPQYTDMFDRYDENKGVYYRNFFSSEADTLIELSVVLYNLDDLTDRDRFDSLNGFNAEKVIGDQEIFDHKNTLQ